MQSKRSTFRCFLVLMQFIRPLLSADADAVISSLMSSGFGGRIVRQTDSVNNIVIIILLIIDFLQDYSVLKLDMNAACLADPAVIVMPGSEQDVSLAVLAAQDAGLALSVRGGGHSYTCNSVKNNSVQLDMRDMDTISLGQDTRSPTGLAATLGAGATWGEVGGKG